MKTHNHTRRRDGGTDTSIPTPDAGVNLTDESAVLLVDESDVQMVSEG